MRTIDTAQELIDTIISLHPSYVDMQDFERAASVLGAAKLFNVPNYILTEALSIALPEQREFWLRVEATQNERFRKGLAAFMAGPPEETE